MRGILAALVLCATASAQQIGYEGPAILSRGGGLAGRRGAETVRFRAFGQVNGIYDTGITPVSVESDGTIPQVDAYGVQALVGLYGYHNWRQSALGVDYRGDYRHYNQKTFFNGTDHALSLDYTNQLSRRVTFAVRPTVGTTSRAVGGFITPLLADLAAPGIPAAELFDGRTNYGQGSASVIWQKSARLSFSAGGQGFLTRRRSAALIGMNGYAAVGDIAYRLSRHKTVSLNYSYNRFDFTNAYGSSDVHQLSAGYAQRIGRYWELGLNAGVMRLENKGLQRVAIDPVIAALLGQTTTVIAFHRLNHFPYLQANLDREFRKSRIGVRYTQGVRPGNGFFLTSRTKNVSAYAGYTGIRRWNFSVSTTYQQWEALMQNYGKFETFGGGAGFSYRMTPIFHLYGRFDVRRADVSISGFRRDASRATLGIIATPGELPVSIW